MSVESLILWSLVTWRITALVVYDSITAGLRDRLGVRYDEHSEAYGTNIVASAITCHKCLSIWVAAAVALFAFGRGPLSQIVTYTLAFSAGSIIVNRIVNGE